MAAVIIFTEPEEEDTRHELGRKEFQLRRRERRQLGRLAGRAKKRKKKQTGSVHAAPVAVILYRVQCCASAVRIIKMFVTCATPLVILPS